MRVLVFLVGLSALWLTACRNGEIGTGSDSALPRGHGVTIQDPDTGTVTTVYDDGTVLVRNADGTSTITRPDGSTTELDADGNVVAVIENGPASAGVGTDPNPDPLDSTAVPRDLLDNAALNKNPEFNVNVSLAAFQQTVYPVLRANCSGCHSSARANQRPLHADADVGLAHEQALAYVNLRQASASRFISRLEIDNHNCWSDCSADATTMLEAVQHWSELLGADNLPVVDLAVYPGQVTEDQVREWIATDRDGLAPVDLPYIRYTSLHELHNRGATLDDMNTARAGISKVLNSTARYAPEIVNPVPVDPYSLVYRFDIRDYWGYVRTTDVGSDCLSGDSNTAYLDPGTVEPSAACSLELWDRITRGNYDVSPDDSEWIALGRPANNEGFREQYVEATQLAYTLSRPDVYNDIMQIPPFAGSLERQVGIDKSLTYQFMTVNDAITIGERLMWRAESIDGYYWKTVDQFSMVDFIFYERPAPIFTNERDKSQIITTPVLANDDGSVSIPNGYTGNTGAQAQASEVIFSLPNGLQGYAIFGAGNQRRDDAFTFVVIDPRRVGELPGDRSANGPLNFSGKRLLNGASCMGCHGGGMNRAPDNMRPYIAAAPRGAWTKHATLDAIEELYPGGEVMGEIIENDRDFFLSAQQRIANRMILGTSDKTLHLEPILFLFETAQLIYGYANTISN